MTGIIFMIACIFLFWGMIRASDNKIVSGVLLFVIGAALILLLIFMGVA